MIVKAISVLKCGNYIVQNFSLENHSKSLASLEDKSSNIYRRNSETNYFHYRNKLLLVEIPHLDFPLLNFHLSF